MIRAQQEVSTTSAALQVTHKAIGAEARRGMYDVVLDGERVGSVAMNDTFETPVEPGRHTLQVRNGRNSSRTTTFDAADGEPTRRSTIARLAVFVPPDFDVPVGLVTSEFVLEPLGPEHNERDYAAWTSSMAHIAATPGFAGGSWPREMTRDENREDLERHADDFRDRKGFTYTVLDPAGRDVIGCVYVYPLPDDEGASVRSWVRESHAHLDIPLWRAVSEWLESDWPFAGVQYAPRA